MLLNMSAAVVISNGFKCDGQWAVIREQKIKLVFYDCFQLAWVQGNRVKNITPLSVERKNRQV